MKTLTNMLILTLTAMTLLGACSEGKHSAANPGADKLGTGDSGGGNLYKGRPVESYAVNITTLPAFKNRLTPIMTALTEPRQDVTAQTTHPMLAVLFNSVIKNKTWYLIPGKLETLPKEKTGIAVATEQGALQGAKEVWIDSTLYDAMTEEDQAILLLHEILMGLRILQFESNYNQCLASSYRPELCTGESKKPRGDISQLDARKDYPAIRATVLEILKTYNQNTYAEWSDLMARNNFLPERNIFERKESRGKISSEKFLDSLKRAKIANKLPTYGYRDYSTRPPETCRLDFTKDPNGRLRLTLNTGSETKEILLNVPTEMNFSTYDSYGRSLRNFHLSEVSEPNFPVEGQKVMSVQFLFSYDTLFGIEFVEMITTRASASNSSYSSENLNGGFNYLCVTENSLDMN